MVSFSRVSSPNPDLYVSSTLGVGMTKYDKNGVELDFPSEKLRVACILKHRDGRATVIFNDGDKKIVDKNNLWLYECG